MHSHKTASHKKNPESQKISATRTQRYRIILALIAAFGIIVAMNSAYLTARLRFLISGPSSSQSVTVVPETEDLTMTDAYANINRVEPHMLWIQKIGVEVPIVFVYRKGETAYQEALRHGVGHFPDTAEIGEFGNAYIFGHSSDFAWSDGDYKTIFALLPELEIGDTITASNVDGVPFVYRVTETRVVDPKDTTVLDQFDNQKRMLTLQTSYPLGTALKRYIVIAEYIGLASGEHENSGEPNDQ